MLKVLDSDKESLSGIGGASSLVFFCFHKSKMGKGGTKYHNDAIGARSKFVGYTGKDRKRDLDEFLATGNHPDLARRSRDQQSHILPQLPTPKVTRPFVFLEFSINKNILGKVVCETYDDIVPIQTAFFLSRVTRGDTKNTIARTHIHKILPSLALFGGKSPQQKDEVQHMKREPTLRHVDGGILSIRLDGSEYCLVLDKALHLDESHQVIGRVAFGMDVLQKLSSLSTKPDDTPVQNVLVTRCGMTDCEGVLETDVVGDGAIKESKETTVERLQQQTEETRHAVQ